MMFKKIMAGALASVMIMTAGIIPQMTTSAEYTGLKYDDYLYYMKIDMDNDDVYDYVEITDCVETAAKVDIPEIIDGLSVASIGGYAFNQCESLESITIPDSVKSIGYGAFFGCSFTSITIPDGVTSIRGYTFQDCKNLKSVIIPDSVTAIEQQAFYNCSSLANVTIPDSVTKIDLMAFYKCSSLTDVTIPDSVISIGTWAFSDCSSLESITIPDSVEYIGTYVFSDTPLFENQSGLKYADTWVIGCDDDVVSAEIKAGTKGIASDAFENSQELTSVTIPDSVMFIPLSIFDYCTKLESINVSKNNPNYLSTDGVLFNKKKTNLITFPAGKADKKYTIPDSVISIELGAFSGCSNLEGVMIPDSVTSIELGAFSGCSNLKSVTIPDSVTYIGMTVFSYCLSLESVTIPDSVTYIGERAFSGCSSLAGITIPDSITYIDNSAFSGCSSLTSVTIPSSVTYIGERAFCECSNLESITILNSECEIYSNNLTINNGKDNKSFWKYYYNGIICGYENSTAQFYAEMYGYKFESLGEYTPIWNVSDVIALQNFLMKKTKVIGNYYDLNNDDKLNVFDLIALKRKVIG